MIRYCRTAERSERSETKAQCAEKKPWCTRKWIDATRVVYSEKKKEMFCFKEQARPSEACGNDVYRIFHVDLGQYLSPEPDLMRPVDRRRHDFRWVVSGTEEQCAPCP